MPIDSAHVELAADLGRMLLARRLRMATAESCTGGLASAAITAIAGSSDWFERGFVTYSNEAKCEMLGVPRALIDAHGAVSEPVARAMADGALAHSRADCALSITGVAGPAGGTPAKTVGTVCFGWRVPGAVATSRTLLLPGDRAEIRAASVEVALRELSALLRARDIDAPRDPV
jgi:nicotinamide-nucleotide amidase